MQPLSPEQAVALFENLRAVEGENKDPLYLAGFIQGFADGAKGYHAHIERSVLLPQARGYFEGWLIGRTVRREGDDDEMGL